MFNKKFCILTLFLIALLSISVVSAEDSADAIVLENSDADIVLNEENSNLEVSSSDSTLEDLSIDDTEEADLDDTDTDSVETGSDVSNEIDCEDVYDVDADDITLNSKTKNTLQASSSDEPYNVYVESVSQKYNYGKYLYLGWEGYFSGYFKVFDSDWDCVYSEYISGYDQDLQWSLKGLNVGKYTAGLVDTDNYWVEYGTIKITKSSSKISVKSFKATAKKIYYCYAYVTDKYNGGGYNGGKVKFRINGKNYYAKLKNGVAVLKFRVPKKAKKYTCKATFLGGRNVIGSSTKFKMTVKKAKTKKYKVRRTSSGGYIKTYKASGRWYIHRSSKYITVGSISNMYGHRYHMSVNAHNGARIKFVNWHYTKNGRYYYKTTRGHINNNFKIGSNARMRYVYIAYY